MNFAVGMLVEACAISARGGIERIRVIADTEDLLGEAANREAGLVRKRRTGNGEDTGSDQSGRRQ